MPDEHKLKGELKDIYERVMNTPVSSNTSQNTQDAKTPPKMDPPPQAHNTQQPKPPTPIPQPPQNFIYSSKHGKKVNNQAQNTSNPQEKKPEQKTREEKIVVESKPHKALYVGAGTAVFTIIYAVIWAFFFGLV